MKKITVDQPKTTQEFEEYYFLRWKILRKPFNKKKGTEKDNLEKDSNHIYIKNKTNSIIAIGRIHIVENTLEKIAQIRFMAVDYDFQGLGLGTIILKELEKQAKKKSVHSLANYLIELAQLIHSYYSAHRFIVDDDELRNARIALIAAASLVINDGLSILGVSAPEKM